jgi:hypothetical protein
VLPKSQTPSGPVRDVFDIEGVGERWIFYDFRWWQSQGSFDTHSGSDKGIAVTNKPTTPTDEA